MSVLATTREGGQTIGYRDEDPFVRRQFDEKLAAAGVSNTMSPALYTSGAPQANAALAPETVS